MTGILSVLLGGRALDPNPDAFSFTNATGAERSTLTTSNTITPTGYDTASSFSVTNGGQGSVNGGAYASSGTISPGQTLTVQGTSSSSFSTAATFLVSIGSTQSTWSVTTRAALEYIALAHSDAPLITVYPWSGSGFGTKFANPAQALTSQANAVAFSKQGNYIAVADQSTTYLNVYPWSASGFGTRFTQPASPPTNVGGIDFSPSGDAIAFADQSTPFIFVYPWSGGGFGTKFSNPATLPGGGAQGVAFNPAGNAIAVAHSGTPFVTAYPWSGGGFGTKFANPATLPPQTGRGVAFSPSGNAIAVSHNNSPYLTAYPWSGSGFGAKYADPATLPAGIAQGNGVSFSPLGNAIATGGNISGGPYVTAYSWSDGGGFGSKFTDPATPVPAASYNTAFSFNGGAIAVSHSTTPYVTAYPWSGSGFGAKYANPATLPTGTGRCVAFGVN